VKLLATGDDGKPFDVDAKRKIEIFEKNLVSGDRNQIYICPLEQVKHV
jgi:hypothetical protein